MNNSRKEKEEHLECLWEAKENGQDSVDDLQAAMNGNYDVRLMDELSLEGLVVLNEEATKVGLTQAGNERAQAIIRAHRIGERLIYDIFGGDFETAACEFEHTVTAELVDGICTLLGHPHECPHGMSIPAGECCKSSADTAQRQILSLTELEVGQTARVAYINVSDDREMHRLDGLQIRPRAVVKLHQKYPCYVVECDGAHIAMDEEIVSGICVWSQNGKIQPQKGQLLELDRKHRKRRGLDFLFGRKL